MRSHDDQLLEDANNGIFEAQIEIFDVINKTNKRSRELCSKIIKLKPVKDSGVMSLKGIVYAEGLNVDADFKKAAYWFRKGIKEEDDHSIAWLAYLYDEGKLGEKNRGKAFELYRKGASLGNSSCQYNLGQCYNEGAHVQKDKKKAVYWWKKAAENNHSLAQCNLGVAYENGKSDGVSRANYRSALKWYKLAMANGNKLAKKNYRILKEWLEPS